MVADVRDHERSSGQPGDSAERREVGGEDEVAVAGVPARHGVPVDGVHVDVDRQEVVATLHTVLDHVVEEQP